ncbi:hypothetical protein Pcinc_016375 [Petrolisthes cinctipes]|uniref:Uncharacterized protein n=1 Tax=Petrolisthes cinctipes TaxID=88211 RepID=A0AAE1FTT7_PETCI|nr:hypothetical protein Pcinc_016375 [Petrolisthes cinctipes]
MTWEVPRTGFLHVASSPRLTHIFLALVQAFLKSAEESTELRASGGASCSSRTQGEQTSQACGSNPSTDQQSAWREQWRCPSVAILAPQPGTIHRAVKDWERRKEGVDKCHGRKEGSKRSKTSPRPTSVTPSLQQGEINTPPKKKKNPPNTLRKNLPQILPGPSTLAGAEEGVEERN